MLQFSSFTDQMFFWPCRTSLSIYSDMITQADVHITTASSARHPAYVVHQMKAGLLDLAHCRPGRRSTGPTYVPRRKRSAMLLNK